MVKIFFFINYLMSIFNINNKIFDSKNKILFSRKLDEKNITLNNYFKNNNDNNDILFDDYNFYLIVLLDFI